MEELSGAEQERTGFRSPSWGGWGTWWFSPRPRLCLPPSSPSSPRTSSWTFAYFAPWKSLRFQGFPQPLRVRHCRQINVWALSFTLVIIPFLAKSWHSKQWTVSWRNWALRGGTLDSPTSSLKPCKLFLWIPIGPRWAWELRKKWLVNTQGLCIKFCIYVYCGGGLGGSVP